VPTDGRNDGALFLSIFCQIFFFVVCVPRASSTSSIKLAFLKFESIESTICEQLFD
jgi:hypothetical protein